LRYLSLTRQSVAETAPDLVVWPEFAVGFYLDREPSLRTQLNWLTYELQTFLLVGAPRVEEIAGKKHFYNSAYLINAQGRTVDVYDKIHLVPFAEHSPFAFPAFLPHTPDFPSQFTAGARSTIFTLPRGSFGALICFEATYPSLARQLVRGGAQFLVNISNDHWLNAGGTAAAIQHFALAVFRAVENRRFLVRAAAQGVSGFVDPTGRQAQFSAAAAGAMMERVAPRHELTLYTQYGDWFVYICAGYALIALLPLRSPMGEAEEKP
jgi:apolipoprotein N-acyltransferase